MGGRNIESWQWPCIPFVKDVRPSASLCRNGFDRLHVVVGLLQQGANAHFMCGQVRVDVSACE